MARTRLALGRDLYVYSSLPVNLLAEGVQVGDWVFDQSTGQLYSLSIFHVLQLIATTTGIGTPGGVPNSAQYNNAGVLGGTSINATATPKYLQQVSSGVPSFVQVSDADLSLTNVTTNNVTIAAHGFAPKAPNDAAKYLDGTGAYSVPAGTGSGSVTSVALTVPAQEFTVSGSPITTLGTLAISRKAHGAIGNITGAVTLDFASGVLQTFTLTGNVTFTFSNPVDGTIYTLILSQDATGGRTITWPAAVKFSGGAFPLTTTPSKTDTVRLAYDGTNYWQVGGAFEI